LKKVLYFSAYHIVICHYNNEISMKRISEYFENETQSLLHRYSNIESLIPKVKKPKNSDSIPEGSYHTGEEGRFLEELIKSILNKHLPESLRAVSGFILRPATQIGKDDTRRIRDQKTDLHSTQLDIIVYDLKSYPVFETFGDFAIAPPEGVIAIISVKKNLYFGQIENEIKALNYAASLCWTYNYREDSAGYKGQEIIKGPITALLTFKNKAINRDLSGDIMNILSSTYDESTPADSMIKQISVINEMTLFRGKERFEDEKFRIPFIKFNHAERINFPIQMILRSILEVYYDQTRSTLQVRPGYIDFDTKTLQEKEFNGKLVTTKIKLDFEFMENQREFLTNETESE
jgi:hypothetical protein